MGGSYHRRQYLLGIIVFLLFFATFSCRRESFSPSQADSFIKFYGNPGFNQGADVKALADGGYVLAGTTSSGSSSKIILIFTDKYGNQTGDPIEYGGEDNTLANSMIITSDGGFAILGSAIPEDGGNPDMFLVRTDNQGNEIWTKRYGTDSNEIGYSLSETFDGGFILIGSTGNQGSANTNIFLVRTDNEGEKVWSQTHGGLNEDAGLYISETENGYIYTGYTKSYSQSGQANSNIFVVKTNLLGRVIFPYTYGGTGDDVGRSLIPLPEGGYILMGTTTNSSTNNKNVFLGHIDEDISVPKWTKPLGGNVINLVASCMKITAEGNFIITGTQEITAANHVIFLLKTDQFGNQIFFRTFGGSGFQRAKAVDLASDGGYIITGSNESGGNSMLTLIKTDADGEL